jgi:predicted signal transduction protein with EAL and GGDEF domain
VEGLPVTASTGISSFPADGRTADQLSRIADLALLGTKRSSDRGNAIDVSRQGDSVADAVDEVNGDTA